MQPCTNKKFWDSYYGKSKPHKVNKVIFADLFEKYLAPESQKSALEIGCAGGEFLCYIAKRFQYSAFGVDYSDKLWTTEELFKFNDLPSPTLFKADIFKWNPDMKFDLVCSFGFLEHFDDPAQVIKRHVEFLKPGGMLIITMPHFAHLQYLFHWLIDRDNLKKHNTKIMNLKSLRSALRHAEPAEASPAYASKQSKLEILYLNYFRTFGFWTERPCHPGANPAQAGGAIGSQPFKFWERIIYHAIQLSGRVLTKLLGPQYPNPLFSPHIVLMARLIQPFPANKRANQESSV